MADTGVKYPGTLASTKFASENNGWTNPEYAGSNDGVNYANITAATFDSPDVSYGLVATNLSLGIPAGATINGIVVTVERHYANGTVSDSSAQLIYSSTLRGTAKNSGTNWGAFPSSDGTVVIGSSSDTWGYTGISAAICNDTTFGVVYWCAATGTDSDAFVDYISVQVYYTPSSQNVSYTSTVIIASTVAATKLSTITRTSAVLFASTVSAARQLGKIVSASIIFGSVSLGARVCDWIKRQGVRITRNI